MKVTTIKVENLKCHGCAKTITKNLEKQDGIDKVDVKINDSSVAVSYDPDKISLDYIKKKLASYGYPEIGNNSLKANVKSYYSCMVGRINK